MSSTCYWCMTDTVENGTCTRCKRAAYQPAAGNQDALPPGTRLDNGSPVVGAVIGRGGFGITYVALDEEMKPPRKIALKEFMPRHMATRMGLNLSVDPEHQEEYEHSQRAFARESAVINRLREHPNIVKVYYSFTENNTAYYGMEFLDGKSLKEWIRDRGKPLTGREACVLLNPIMDALAYTHRQGLLHRDISPNNIFLCGNSDDILCVTPKLIDYGAAYAYVGNYTKSCALIKTKGFTPVEQILFGTECQGSWTDVYAFCAVFYYAITGRNLPDSKDRYLDGTRIPSLSELGVHIPKAAEKTLMDGLAVEYKSRIQTVDEVQQRLCEAFGVTPYHFTKPADGDVTGVVQEPVPPQNGPKSVPPAPQPATVPKPGANPPPPPPPPPPRPAAGPGMKERILGGILELVIFYGAAWLVAQNWTALLYGMAAMTLANMILCSVASGGTLGMRLSRLTLKDDQGRNPSVAIAMAYSFLTAFFPLSAMDCMISASSGQCWRERVLGLHTQQRDGSAPQRTRPAAAQGEAYLETASGERYPVHNGTVVTRRGHETKGGRNQIVLNDETVSGLHCEFILTNNEWYIVDRHSTNHTYINDQIITPGAEIRLIEGSRVGIGSQNMTFHC